MQGAGSDPSRGGRFFWDLCSNLGEGRSSISGGGEVGEDDVETEADLLEGDIAVAEVTYRQPCNYFFKFQRYFGPIVVIAEGK